MAVITDEAMAAWRDWVNEEDEKTKLHDAHVKKYYEHIGREDQGDVLARQVGGDHYKRAHQPWEIIEEWELNYWAGNVVKYLLRYKYKKDRIEDLRKAQHYLQYLIKHESSLQQQ